MIRHKTKDFLFRFWLSTTSHGYTLIRSEMQYNDIEYSNKYNEYHNGHIDIEFADVNYIEMPMNLNGIKLSVVQDMDLTSRLLDYCKQGKKAFGYNFPTSFIPFV